MSKISQNNNTANTSNEAHQTLLINPSQNTQKAKTFPSDRLINILVGILALLFIIVLILTIFLAIHCYSNTHYFTKILVAQNKSSMVTDQLVSTTVRLPIINNILLGPGLSASQGKYMENNDVAAFDD
ncbi:unnamed protein product [Adineta steineri]|uniref:Uncharacterized protein n=1 Tax=Adineta steineri TaxID=433720 RepID=A0A819WQT1_9BILA|nr:unnamed protein product [Adineta steineri]CAF1291054.1 unnamed protein product [Adineta steineri]CAF3964744.1 unnamed protein product [Adineta steineri]CAF4126274.1 unnamed protein product [Adineta steineri]